MLIKCYKCKEKKEESNFYVCPSLPRHFSIYCKSCEKQSAKERNKRPEYHDRLFAFAKTDRGREIRRKSTQKMREKYPQKWAARIMVRSAIKNGIIVKQPCFICGEIEVQAHHEDYTKPLEIIFLCRNCHYKRHQVLKLLNTKEE